MNAVLWRFPAWFHGLAYFLAGCRLACVGDGEYRWLTRREYWAALLDSEVIVR